MGVPGVIYGMSAATQQYLEVRYLVNLYITQRRAVYTGIDKYSTFKSKIIAFSLNDSSWLENQV